MSKTPDFSTNEMLHTFNQLVREGKVDMVDMVPLSLAFQGQPLNIKARRPMFAPMFTKNRKFKKDVFICGRQIGKTVSISSSIIMNAIWREYFRLLYVAPMAIYTQRLHSMFMQPMIRQCQLPWAIQNNQDCVSNVNEKSFLTGSRFTGISAYNNPNNALGITVDWLMFDETQDLNADFIPQIRETTGTSEFRYESYFGTARSVDNTLTVLFENSTQNLWRMPCPHHGCKMDNYPTVHGRVLDMIRPAGISCVHCGKLLDVEQGFWTPSFEFNETSRDTVGYQVPQIIIKDRIHPHDRYIDTIYNKLHGSTAYSEARFLQEVLGIPTSQGGVPITQQDIMAASTLDLDQHSVPSMNKYMRVGGGADWGGSEVTSFTVGVLVGYVPGCFHVLGAIRPTGLPDEQRHFAVGDFLKSASLNRIEIVGGDAGFVGSVQNPNLAHHMQVPVASLAYGTTKRFFVPQVNDCFTVDRTTLIYITLTLIKQKKILFPKGAWFDKFTKDLLAIYTEDVVNTYGLTIRRYARYPQKADDFLHALGYAIFVTALGTVDLPEMIGMPSQHSLNAPYINDIGQELGEFRW